MKNIILILALNLVPFFALADIFNDGTVSTQAPKVDDRCEITAVTNGTFNHLIGSDCGVSATDICQAYWADNAYVDGTHPEYSWRNIYGGWENDNGSSYKELHCGKEEWSKGYWNGNVWTKDSDSYGNQTNIGYGQEQFASCPPDAYPSLTYPVTNSETGEVESCADPNQINLVDSCNVSSGNTQLNITVTEQNGCFTQTDGSVCQYAAVDVGGGNQIYQMNLEGDCYSESYPSLDENGVIGELPSGGECVNNGGLYACPEDPETMCTSGTCEEGCGYVNDQFVCYDIDTDGDGLPDYNDPDVDGDGIPNDDDLDADGDGQDDPINGDGTPSVNVDLTPVVEGLGDIQGILEGEGMEATPKGFFDLDAANAAVEVKRTELSTFMTTVRNEANTLVPQLTTGAGSFSGCYDIASFRGNKKQTCIDDFSDEMTLIAQMILLICSVIAAIIVFTGGRRD